MYTVFFFLQCTLHGVYMDWLTHISLVKTGNLWLLSTYELY